MGLKEKIAEILENGGDKYISGSQIAESLGVTRAAVWKGIQALEVDGYRVEGVSNRGYRLSQESDPVSGSVISKHLGDFSGVFTVEAAPSVDSTNLVLKRQAAELSPWHVAVSGSQTAGRGRLGRSFYSPPDTGLYMSLFLRPDMPAAEASKITSAAAVAVCEAIEECIGVSASIKWVNDIFVGGKKVCGILTEAAMDMESGSLDYAILGVGINVYEPQGGFPEELKDIAGCVAHHRQRDLRGRIAASILRRFYALYSGLAEGSFVEEYRRRSFLIGQDIYVLRGSEKSPATAVDVDRECRLIVKYPDGRTEALSSGEVSVRPVKGAYR